MSVRRRNEQPNPQEAGVGGRDRQERVHPRRDRRVGNGDRRGRHRSRRRTAARGRDPSARELRADRDRPREGRVHRLVRAAQPARRESPGERPWYRRGAAPSVDRRAAPAVDHGHHRPVPPRGRRRSELAWLPTAVACGSGHADVPARRLDGPRGAPDRQLGREPRRLLDRRDRRHQDRDQRGRHAADRAG